MHRTIESEEETALILQKCIHIDSYFFIVWAVSTGLALNYRNIVDIPKALAVAVYILLLIVETSRVCLARHRHFTENITRLAWFMLISLMVQMPLVTFFAANPLLKPTPLEATLHNCLLTATTLECGISIASVVLAIIQAQKNMIPCQRMNDLTFVPHRAESSTVSSNTVLAETPVPRKVRCNKAGQAAQRARVRSHFASRRTRPSKSH